MSGIAIVSSQHMCHNPRVAKEATTLAASGYDTTVFTPSFDESLATEDAELAQRGGFRHWVYADLRPTARSPWTRFWLRAQSRLAREGLHWLGWNQARTLGYGLPRLLSTLRRQGFDLVIGHQEGGIWIAAELQKAGRCVGADIEDWYSRDHLPGQQRRLPIRLLVKCEARVIQGASHLTTTSQAMAEALHRCYGGRPARVLHNVFPWADRERLPGLPRDVRDPRHVSLHWFSQRIGPGRGLEELGRALALVREPVQVHLRGRHDDADAEWVRGFFGPDSPHELALHQLVPARQLLGHIASHDVGLALELNYCENKNLTISNKLFHYLLGGLAVVATDTAGQAEAAAAANGAVCLAKVGSVDELAAAIQQWVGHPAQLAAAKAAALAAARDHFCWERQAPILLESVARALTVARRGAVTTSVPDPGTVQDTPSGRPTR